MGFPDMLSTRFLLILHYILAIILIYGGYVWLSQMINSDAEGPVFWLCSIMAVLVAIYGAYKILWLISFHKLYWNLKG